MSILCEEKRAAFRALHQQHIPFVIPNPWDVGSARILHGFGFKALATTSAGMAFSMGVCEGESTRDTVMDHCRMLVDATPLPVSADLEKGFADTPDGVAETVTLAGEIGLAGCSIEDHTGDRANPIFDQGLAVERVAAAVEAAHAISPNFILTARCESFLWGGTDLDAVIRRLQAFEAVGADVLYAPGLKDLDSIRTLCQSVTRPVNIVMGMPGATFDLDALKQAGVKRVSIGSAFARLAYGSLLAAAQEIQDHGSFGFSAHAAGFAAIENYFRKSP